MRPHDVKLTKGTTHLVSAEVFCQIVDYEPQHAGLIGTKWKFSYSIAKRRNEFLICSRAMLSKADADALLSIVVGGGGKVILEPEMMLTVIPALPLDIPDA